MNRSLVFSAALAAVLVPSLSAPATAGDLLTGKKKQACEAMLCLASGDPPHECANPLDIYFDIKFDEPDDTIDARRDFLSACPASDSSPEMNGLADALARGAGRCDVGSLNRRRSGGGWLGITGGISNQLPPWCSVYYDHPYTALADLRPRYVGAPRSGGHWVAGAQYEQAQAQWQATHCTGRAGWTGWGGWGTPAGC